MKKWPQANSFLLALLVVSQFYECKGCIEKEKVGLLLLKEFIISNSEEAEDVLPSWVDDQQSDCCGWERVSCNPITGHVTELALNTVMKASPYYSYLQPLSLNASLFVPFPELLSLDLSQNGFSCCLENEGFKSLKMLEMLNFAYNKLENISESLGALMSLKTLNLSSTSSNYRSFPIQEFSTLTNLEILDASNNDYYNCSLSMKEFELLSRLSKLKYLELSYNHFGKEIFRFLSALSDLKYLNLEINEMEGPLSNQELLNMSNLEVLILRDNKLNGSLPIQDLSDFRNLKILDLSKNSFIGSISSDIENLSSLRALSLADNQLNGSLPIPGLCKLKNLEELDISKNSVQGSLPQCLVNLSSLTVLDLSDNQFTGNISSSLISSLSFLVYIDLRHNHFEGSFPFSSFANHSGLEVVELGYNTKLEVETESSNWIPKFQLKVLALQNCNLNNHTGNVPRFLLQQHKLEVVDLSHNKLKGNFPLWLLENKATLYALSLRNNSFHGQIHLPLSPLTSLFWMDLSNNYLDGQLQENVGKILPNLIYLNLSKNAFGGNVLSSICDMRTLDRLDLSFNNFSGEVPTQLVGGCCPDLVVFKLSNNNFHGQILSSHFNLTNIAILHLNDNKFSGMVSNALSRSSLLIKLDIGNNYMSGLIPNSMRNMSSLESVIMRENFFKGQLPSDVSPLILFLDVSMNELSGGLPSEPNLQFCEHIHLQGNKFTGPLPKSLVNSSSLLTLDIRDNSLSGSIPSAISTISNLRVLLLSGNRFSGAIPHQLCQLQKLSLLDLSNNSLSGPIPRCFKNIAFGKMGGIDDVFTTQAFVSWYTPAFGTYGNLMVRILNLHDTDDTYREQDEVEFVTKSRLSSYKGYILNFMSGMDLSCNNLTGEIPSELGQLGWIHALNLSNNHLVGSIPTTFSNLTQIESLDLSHNQLSGEIPSELIGLYFLAVFSVAYNNLTGPIPDRKAQFGTFESSSYEGNPFLCGPPLEKNCSNGDNGSPASPGTRLDESEGKWYEIEPVVFFASFSVSYIVFFMTVITLLYINPYWRHRLLYHTEEFMYSCYYSVSSALRKLSALF